MPRSLKPLVTVLALLLCWSVVSTLVTYQLDILVATGLQPTLPERAIIAGNLWVLRWLPFLLMPAFLAPAGATGFWLLSAWRHWPHVTGELAISNLRMWLKVWACIVVGGAVVLGGIGWYSGRASSKLGIAMLAGFGWSYAAALYNALWGQNMLHKSGASRWSGTAVAWAAFGIVNCAPVTLLGAGIPLWVAWASRHARAAG